MRTAILLSAGLIAEAIHPNMIPSSHTQDFMGVVLLVFIIADLIELGKK